MKQFFLIDWFAFLYRAYYAFPEMRNDAGKNVNAVYGFLRMMLKRVVQKPDFFMIAWDWPVKTFRHEMFPEYKATRKKMEDDFKDQIPLIQTIVQELWIPSLIMPWYEADDVLANVIWRFKEHEDVVFQLFTGDKDLKQLLDDRVYVVSPDKEIPYKKADFLRDYGFDPALIVDYLALLGDSADNVKGVMGIGEKKALTLVQEYGSIEHMYEQLSQISVSVRNILEAGKEDAFQSKRLIELAKIDMSDKKLENFAFGLDLALWMEVLGDRYHFSSLKKTLSEMKKEAEKPQQLWLF